MTLLDLYYSILHFSFLFISEALYFEIRQLETGLYFWWMKHIVDVLCLTLKDLIVRQLKPFCQIVFFFSLRSSSVCMFSGKIHKRYSFIMSWLIFWCISGYMENPLHQLWIQITVFSWVLDEHVPRVCIWQCWEPKPMMSMIDVTIKHNGQTIKLPVQMMKVNYPAILGHVWL